MSNSEKNSFSSRLYVELPQDRRPRKRRRRKPRWGRILLLLAVIIALIVFVPKLFAGSDEVGSKVNVSAASSEPTGVVVEPQTATAVIASYQPPRNITVVLDAGHGGKDGGTACGDAVEKDINLQVVKMLAALLEEDGFSVQYVREGDEYVSLNNRGAIANIKKGELLVSLHCNSFDDAEVSGTEIYYSVKDGAQELAESISARIDANDDMDVRRCEFHKYQVLYDSQMPAVLIEMGFLSNDDDRQKLLDEEWLQDFAEAIELGVRNFCESGND